MHLELIYLVMATDEAYHMTCYDLNRMDSKRVQRVRRGQCQRIANSRCRARQLPLKGVIEYCRRFHNLSEEC